MTCVVCGAPDDDGSTITLPIRRCTLNTDHDEHPWPLLVGGNDTAWCLGHDHTPPDPHPAPLLGNDSLLAPGGWCAPSATLYDPASLDTGLYTVTSTFPEVTAHRGIRYEPPTPAQRAAAEAYAAFVRRTTERLTAFRAAAVDAACVTALAHGYDVHVYDPPVPYNMSTATDADLARLRRVGIAFTPAAHPVPTITHHPAPDAWEWDEDDD